MLPLSQSIKLGRFHTIWLWFSPTQGLQCLALVISGLIFRFVGSFCGDGWSKGGLCTGFINYRPSSNNIVSNSFIDNTTSYFDSATYYACFNVLICFCLFQYGLLVSIRFWLVKVTALFLFCVGSTPILFRLILMI